MRRALSVVAVLAMLAMLLPMSVMAASDNGGRAAAQANKITICHSPNGVNPRAILINKSAWPAHKAHGDTVVTPTTPCVPKPKTNATVCTFSAASSQYFTAPVPPATTGVLFATGPIEFRWNVDTKAVQGGSWDEYTVADPATKLHNVVTAGTVTGTAVSLTFTRTIVPPPDYVFPFTGTLTSASPGPATLTGMMAGPTYPFSATGTVTCRAGNGSTGS